MSLACTCTLCWCPPYKTPVRLLLIDQRLQIARIVNTRFPTRILYTHSTHLLVDVGQNTWRQAAQVHVLIQMCRMNHTTAATVHVKAASVQCVLFALQTFGGFAHCVTTALWISGFLDELLRPARVVCFCFSTIRGHGDAARRRRCGNLSELQSGDSPVLVPECRG